MDGARNKERGAKAVSSLKYIVLISLLVVAACTTFYPPPSVSELDWSPPSISSSGCPNFTGRYVAKSPDGASYRWLLLDEVRSLYSSRETYLRDREMDVVLTVESRSDGIYVAATNGRERVDAFTKYDGVLVGCAGGVLVSRYVRKPVQHPESGGGVSVSYGEYRISRAGANGDIQVVGSHRVRCGRWGGLASKAPGGADADAGCRSFNNSTNFIYRKFVD